MEVHRGVHRPVGDDAGDRKSTRLNSSHVEISYAVFCLKKKKKEIKRIGSSDRHTRQTHRLTPRVRNLKLLCLCWPSTYFTSTPQTLSCQSTLSLYSRAA